VTLTVAINGSPRKERGDTALVLDAFLRGVQDAGSTTETVYAGKLHIKPCDCGTMHCWYGNPGQCVHRDDMGSLYDLLARADILVLATPVYIPLPGDMQNLINRLCPLIEPLLETRGGRTRARFRSDVRIGRMALVSTGGWWEKDNFETVVHIVRELCENASVTFGGAALRPHAFLMKSGGKLTPAAQPVLQALRQAGRELAQHGRISEKTSEAVSTPLIGETELLERYNKLLEASRRATRGHRPREGGSRT
jgi:multimeric flavodoxin WrbA